MNTKLATTALTLFLITGIASAQTYNGPSTNLEAQFINSDPVPLQSGEAGDIRLKIVNKGDTEAETTVRLIDNYPFEIKPDRQRNYSLGEVTPGQEYQISTEVLVANDAPDGSNDFKVKIIQGEFEKIVNIPVEVQSNDIELNLANLDTQPSQLMPDTENNQISIDLVNNGEKAAENVVLNLVTPDFFEQTSSFSSRKALGNIKPGERKTSTFNLDLSETSPSGMATLETVTLYSADDSTSKVEQRDTFQLNVEGKPQFEVSKTEGNLTSGTTKEFKLEIKNTGSEKSTSTRIRVLDSSDQPFDYDSASKYIGTLESGQTGEAVFEVDTESDAAVKEYLLDFEVRGVKDTEVFVEDKTIQAQVLEGEEGSSRISPMLIGAVLVVVLAAGFFFRDRIRNLF